VEGKVKRGVRMEWGRGWREGRERGEERGGRGDGGGRGEGWRERKIVLSVNPCQLSNQSLQV
jgi:hypothetical protein